MLRKMSCKNCTLAPILKPQSDSVGIDIDR